MYSRYIPEIDESVDEGISGKSFKAIKNESVQQYSLELQGALKSFLEALKVMDPLESVPESIDISLDELLNKPRVHLVEEFLLVKSLREGGSFKPTKDIKQIISPLLFSARAVCLFGIVEATRNDQLTATARKNLVEQQLFAVSYCATSSAFVWLKQTKALCDADSAGDKMPDISWRDDEVSIAGKMPLAVDIFRGAIQSLLKNLEQDKQVILHGLQISMIGLSSLEILDNNTNSTIGYGFATDTRNTQFHVNRTAIVDHIESSPDLHRKYILPNGGWNVASVRLFAGLMDGFLQKLLFMMVVSGGAPARMTDFALHRAINTPAGGRTLFVLEGHLASELG
ncbi:hypothetical protein HDU98_005522 [Podochytrium sp. JEL0797]|nr:hypothetical protein HDU98_005522 [Podochytrium sp. JEL0797]